MFWRTIIRQESCPHCGDFGSFTRHGRYRKYHYTEQIDVLRVRCRRCRKTHALIPSFSLPGTSIGHGEVEQFIVERSHGVSRAAAGAVFVEKGFSETYPRFLQRRLLEGIQQAKALFPERGDHRLPAWQWLIDAAGTGDHPACTLNRMSIAAGWGAVFCALSSETAGRAENAGFPGSHDMHSTGLPVVPPDSG